MCYKLYGCVLKIILRCTETYTVVHNELWHSADKAALCHSIIVGNKYLLYGNLGNLSTGTDDIDARSLCGVRGGTARMS